jgi:tetrahydromethanopterin S-methyltransferase subunit G
MNELQIRLTADIKDLQSAINKAKATIKSFESETATDSEKSNVGFRRKIGLIEQLTAKAKELKVSLSQATNEQQIAKFNAELEQTNIELSRLNSLGKSFADTSVQSFNKFRVSAGAANGSAIAFNRIIQDAPFGIIGVGNNIQQFAEQLSALRVTTGSTSSALSTFFGSLLTKSNLIVLGISAVTAAFTAYQLGVFDTKKEVDELTKAQEDFNESLKDTNGLLAQGLLNKLLKDVGLLKTENIGGRLVDVPAFKTAGEVVDALSGKINKLRKGELELLEGFLKEQISNATRSYANSNNELEKSLATEEIGLYRGILEKVNQQLKFYKDVAKDAADETKTFFDLQAALTDKQTDFIDKLIEKYGGLKKAIEESPEIKVDESQLVGLELPGKQDPGIIEKLEKEIALYEKLVRVTSDPSQIEKYQLKLSELRKELDLVNGEKVKSNLEIVADAFGSLASGIVSSLDISNRSLRGFLTTLISATPKIIAAIGAQADANLANAGKNIAADKAESISSGIKQGTKAAEALGPVGLALLPVFIAGAVAIISSAFSKTSGGGGSVSAGSGSTFTNRREFGGPVSKGRAYIVGERRPELFVPNTNGVIVPQVPSMDYSGTSMSAGAMAIDVNIQGVSYGDDILFTVQQAQIRRGIR